MSSTPPPDPGRDRPQTFDLLWETTVWTHPRIPRGRGGKYQNTKNVCQYFVFSPNAVESSGSGESVGGVPTKWDIPPRCSALGLRTEKASRAA